jgi:hypothetical protein
VSQLRTNAANAFGATELVCQLPDHAFLLRYDAYVDEAIVVTFVPARERRAIMI